MRVDERGARERERERDTRKIKQTFSKLNQVEVTENRSILFSGLNC